MYKSILLYNISIPIEKKAYSGKLSVAKSKFLNTMID